MNMKGLGLIGDVLMTVASWLYLKRLNDARVNWLQLDPETVTAAVLAFLKAKL